MDRKSRRRVAPGATSAGIGVPDKMSLHRDCVSAKGWLCHCNVVPTPGFNGYRVSKPGSRTPSARRAQTLTIGRGPMNHVCYIHAHDELRLHLEELLEVLTQVDSKTATAPETRQRVGPAGETISAPPPQDARAIVSTNALNVGGFQQTDLSLRSSILGKGAVAMSDVVSSSTEELLLHFHERLDTHFSAVRDDRADLETTSPVFALEHDLSPEDLVLLGSTVRMAVSEGVQSRHRRWWLPFVVYAAESGYDYAGDEYWRSFEQGTPGWRIEHRDLIKSWFRRFADEYGGAIPTGAFAANFSIIAWPITHGVLPTYLQRQLAQLLFEFSGALTSELLDDPPALGLRLARRATSYTERFRIFCENSRLVGQVAAALLSGHEEATPYLRTPTLERIVADLSKEQQARTWLSAARRSALRARGFRPSSTDRPESDRPPAHARSTDPRLFLRLEESWSAYAELPDMTPLGASLPEVYRQLRNARAFVSGGERHVPPSGLLYPAQTVRFARWPRPDESFLRLDRATESINRILADQCVMTAGPWWLFRRQGAGLAVEVKGKFVRPGHRYVLIGATSMDAPALPWATEVTISAEAVRAYELAVPGQVTESDVAALDASGVAVISHIAIRPVGIIASSWDGEGEVEWLAGEPAILGIRSDLAPRRCRLTVGEDVYFLEWPAGETELLFSLQGLIVGTHVANMSLLGNEDQPLTAGSLVITIRDPQVRPEGASIGEGIRVLASPARPTLSELWDERAHLTVDGPAGADADVEVLLRGEDGSPIASLRRSARLPIDVDAWTQLARNIRKDPSFRDAYDDAESCVVAIGRDGVGFATLSCERGYRPLRWRFAREHDGHVVAWLVDRTDGGDTTVEFYNVESPLVAVSHRADEAIHAPPRGGLVVARSGATMTALILPTEPTAVLQQRTARPSVSAATLSSQEIRRLIDTHAKWMTAELPADAFAVYQQQLVGDAFASAIGTLIGGNHWAAVERKLAHTQEPASLLEGMRTAVGIATAHKEVASAIAYSLYEWLSAGDLLAGFDAVIAPQLKASGMDDHPGVSRFLLMLAGRPGYLSEWREEEVTMLLEHVIHTPVLYRAARFAVLGTRAINDASGVERSF